MYNNSGKTSKKAPKSKKKHFFTYSCSNYCIFHKIMLYLYNKFQNYIVKMSVLATYTIFATSLYINTLGGGM